MPQDNKGVVENADGSVVIKAYGGNRTKNLEVIADSITEMLATALPGKGTILSGSEVHQLRGWCEQLRIIADELDIHRR